MNNIKLLREEVGHSQSKLIEEIAKPPYNLKISRRTLQYWESGERDIKLDKAQILADYFGVQLPYLLGWSDIRTVKREEIKSVEKLESVYVEFIGNITSISDIYLEDLKAFSNKMYVMAIAEKTRRLYEENNEV